MFRVSPESLIALYTATLLGGVLLCFLSVRWRERTACKRWLHRQRLCPVCACHFEVAQPDIPTPCPGCGRPTTAHQRLPTDPGQIS